MRELMMRVLQFRHRVVPVLVYAILVFFLPQLEQQWLRLVEAWPSPSHVFRRRTVHLLPWRHVPNGPISFIQEAQSRHAWSRIYQSTSTETNPNGSGGGSSTAASRDGARAGSDGYSVLRQPARWLEESASDPVFAIPESLNDDLGKSSLLASKLDADWWSSSSSQKGSSKEGSNGVVSTMQSEQDTTNKDKDLHQQTSFNLAQRTLDTLDFPRLLQALSIQCTTVPAKRLIQDALESLSTTTSNTTLSNTNTNFNSRRGQATAATAAAALQPLIADTVTGCQERYQAVREMEWILFEDGNVRAKDSMWNEDDLLVTYSTTSSATSNRKASKKQSSQTLLPLIGRPPPFYGRHAMGWERIVEVAVTEARVLDGLDIADVASMLDALQAVVCWNEALLQLCQQKRNEEQPSDKTTTLPEFVQIPAIVSAIVVNTTLQELLHNALDESSPTDGSATALGRLNGETFPTIGRLRQQIRSLKQDIVSTLETLVASPSMQSKLSLESGGPLYSEVSQSGRLVIPVDKKYATGGTLGIVHDTSRSGRTIYIEPNEIIGPTNALKQAEAALRTEEGRVWRMLTEQILRNRNDLETAVAAVGQLDLIMARIQLGRKLSGRTSSSGGRGSNVVIPMVKDEGVIQLSNAKHPVLLLRALENSAMQVMGNDVELGVGSNQGLVLTGPNAGGKTVILKLLGLVALMARTGIPIPADATAKSSQDDFDVRFGQETKGQSGEDAEYQPRVDFFNPVLADIGDLQSVGGDLSTFSGHMLVCREVLNNAGRNALVLMDELGSGTDPNQGVAIAQALLEAVLATGARVAITTHYLQLKQLAATDDRFSVAGMQFVNGRPTYKLLPGIVGESFALAVAERLGLPAAVLARANELLDSETRQMGDLIRDMEDQKALVDEQVAALARKQEEMAALERKIKEEAMRLENKQLDARRVEARKFAKMLEEKEAVLEDILEKLKSDPSRRVLAKSWDDIKFVKRDALNEAENVPSVVARKQKVVAAMEEASADLVPIAEMREKPVLKEGDVVIMCEQGPMLGREATIIKALDSRVEVKVNNMNVSFKLSQIALPTKNRRGASSSTLPRGAASARSKAVEQALASEGSGNSRRRRALDDEAIDNKPASSSATGGGGGGSSNGVTMRTESNTVDVRGCNLVEAQEMVRDKCSTALLAGRRVVFILHGHGTGGVLKSKIRAWLKSERQLVKDFAPADRSDGGDALTRVDLR